MDTTDSSSLPREGIRINKYLASCGYESRRKADQLILDGAVEINGRRVDTLGARVMPGDFVKVNGHHAQPKDAVSLLLNKPRGYVCSRVAQGGENTVYDLLPAKYRFVNYVGRLDTDSEGLLVLTNKGELNQKLTHPNGSVEKEYWVTLNQTYENSVLLQLLKGVRIPEGQAKAKYVARLSPRRACVVLEQGLKRQVRQMFACLGFRVRKLVRVRIGSLWGGDLMPGRAMLMTDEQERLTLKNPPPRKGFISAAQAFPNSGSGLSREQIDRELDEQTTRKGLEEDTDYKFNPADFESDEEAEASMGRAWSDDDDFRPAPRRREMRDEHRPRGGFGTRRTEGDRPRGGFGARRAEGDRPRGGFGARRTEGDRPRGGFGARRAEDDRPRGGFGARRAEGDRPRGGFGSRRAEGDRPRGGNRGFGKPGSRSFSPKRSPRH